MVSKVTRCSLLLVVLCICGSALEAFAQDLFVTQASTLTKRYDGFAGTDLGVFTSGTTGGSRGLSVGPDLNLYVAKGTRIARFHGFTGDYIDDFVSSGPFSTTQGMEWGPDNNLYVCTRSTGVARYDQGGSFLGFFASGAGLDAQDATFGPDGNFYVASLLTDEVRRYNASNGVFIDNFVPAGSGGLNKPGGLVFGPDGNLYVASQANVIKRYNGATGAFIDNFTPGGVLNNPQGVEYGPDGNLYVASTFTGQVRRFNGASGADMGTFASGLANPIYLLFYTPAQPIGTESHSWGAVKARF